LRSIKYCKDIDYLEWVISLMSERVSLRAESTMRITQTSKSLAKLAELRGETATATQLAR
jgi:hypothetical protein